MKRRIVNAIAVGSAMLCVATVVLWVFVHYWPIDSHSKSYVGPLILREDRIMVDQHRIEGFFLRSSSTTKPFTYSSFNQPGIYLHWGRTNGSYFEFHFDYWFLIVVFGLIPLAWVVAALRAAARRRVAARGHTCRACGYDLRATPDRCPECGVIPTKRETR